MITLNKSNKTHIRSHIKSNKTHLKSHTKTIIFIDRALDNYEQLAAGAISGSEVVILEPNCYGIEQITEVLSHNPQLKAIHILCHGSPGCLYLGNSHLGLDNLDDYAAQLQTWASLVTPSSPHPLIPSSSHPITPSSPLTLSPSSSMAVTSRREMQEKPLFPNCTTSRGQILRLRLS